MQRYKFSWSIFLDFAKSILLLNHCYIWPSAQWGDLIFRKCHHNTEFVSEIKVAPGLKLKFPTNLWFLKKISRCIMLLTVYISEMKSQHLAQVTHNNNNAKTFNFTNTGNWPLKPIAWHPLVFTCLHGYLTRHHHNSLTGRQNGDSKVNLTSLSDMNSISYNHNKSIIIHRRGDTVHIWW